jgi:hypothetical protein
MWKYDILEIEGEKWIKIKMDDRDIQVSDHGRIKNNHRHATFCL